MAKDILTTAEYVSWVKRSLNRIYDAGLDVDAQGTTPAEYRSFIWRFQREHGLPETSQVDKATQNALIKANERDSAYLSWVQRALESDGIVTDPPASKPDARGSLKSHGLAMGIRTFQERRRAQGLAVDGFVGAQTEVFLMRSCRCEPPGHVVRPAPARPAEPEEEEVEPLRRDEIELLVWALIDEKPETMSAAELARAFAEFTDLQSLLKKPSVPKAFAALGKTFVKALYSEFAADPERQFGYLVGQSYSLMDAATGARSARRLATGQTEAQERFAEGFHRGYDDLHPLAERFASDPAWSRLMQRLDATKPALALSSIYRSLLDVVESKLRTMKEQQYFAAKETCSFRYPAFGIEECRP